MIGSVEDGSSWYITDYDYISYKIKLVKTLWKITMKNLLVYERQKEEEEQGN